MPILIIEGPDYSGKTTLVNYIMSHCNSVFIHFPIRSENDYNVKIPLIATNSYEQDGIVQNMEDNANAIIELAKEKLVILDRFVVSNIIYRSITGTTPLVLQNYPRTQMVLDLSLCVVLCCDLQTLLNRKKVPRNKTNSALDYLLEEDRKLHEANMAFLRTTYKKINTSVFSPQDAYSRIMNWLYLDQ